MIKIVNLQVSYKDNVIFNNVNLKIEENKITYIIGKNGSGKSTLANVISGLKDFKGKVFIDDQDITKLDIISIRKLIGIVFQNPTNQIVFNRVYDDIKFALVNMKVSDDKIDSIIKKALGDVDMLDYINSNPYNLSLGQRQKIAIASMLALKPKYIIFDEATAFLDINSKKDIYQLIKKISKTTTIIFITNIMDELIHADNVIVLDNGVYEYNKDQILNNVDILKKHNLEIPFTLKVINKYGYMEIKDLL